MSTFSHISIVLVEPQHPGNIGGVARAMKNMELSNLVLVNPRSFPDPIAYQLSSNADDILDAARIVSTFEEAVEGCRWVVGTSARVRTLPWPQCTPRECAERAMASSDRVAIVFGRERSGLFNEELQLCHSHLVIPANPNYSSLNLSHAVQIIGYEIYQAGLSKKSAPTTREVPLANTDEIIRFYDHLESVLKKIDFYDPIRSPYLMGRLKRLFSRTQIEETEMNVLRGILTAIDKVVKE